MKSTVAEKERSQYSVELSGLGGLPSISVVDARRWGSRRLRVIEKQRAFVAYPESLPSLAGLAYSRRKGPRN